MRANCASLLSAGRPCRSRATRENHSWPDRVRITEPRFSGARSQFWHRGSRFRTGVARLTHLLVEYAPDFVISYGGGNDLHSPSYNTRRLSNDFITLLGGTQALARGLDLRSALAGQLFRSRVITLIFASREQEIRIPLGAMRRMVGYRTPEWESAIIEEYSNNLHRMCQLGRAFNFRFYAIFQPLIFEKSPCPTLRGCSNLAISIMPLYAASARPSSRCFSPATVRRRAGWNLSLRRSLTNFRQRSARSFLGFLPRK